MFFFITFLALAQLLAFLPTLVSNETLTQIGPKYTLGDYQILELCVWKAKHHMTPNQQQLEQGS
jgi:hypothetical protein